MSLRHQSAKLLNTNTTDSNSIIAMVTDLWCHLILRGEHGIQCMPCFSRIIRAMVPEIYTVEKCDFLKPILLFSVNTKCY